MNFVSAFFLVLFLATFLARWFFEKRDDRQGYLLFLLGASLFFYASSVPSYFFLLIGMTWIDYWAGRRIAETSDPAAKKSYLLISLISNLGALAFFKYAHFLLANLQWGAQRLGFNGDWGWEGNWVVPLGISFFTFQSLSYTIDLYRGVIQPVRSYWRFLLFVSFFTHLVSGPIVRVKELLYQFDRRRKIRLAVCLQGLNLMIKGFFLKVVVADNLATYVNKYWKDGYIASGSASFSLLLALLFACQIYADFDGYTRIAMGAAYLLGFKLPRNFRYPYIARTFKDFWNRWHITLSHWMRDYLYIPLGGNRGAAGRVYLNLLFTFLLAGLWHGAAYTFVVWGFLHGLALVVERVLGFEKEKNVFLTAVWSFWVQLVVLIAWVFFRSQSVSQALQLVGHFWTRPWGWQQGLILWPAMAFTVPVWLLHARGWIEEKKWVGPALAWEEGAWCALMLFAIFTLYGDRSAFLYFQF